MPGTEPITPITGTSWLESIKKYEKYIPVMLERERKQLAEGTFVPSRGRLGELDNLLRQRMKDNDLIEQAIERAVHRNSKGGEYADTR